jgi:Zn-dependent peptidase ImmA (M78 family)/DNA-binding XRE family transcriptional regulator
MVHAFNPDMLRIAREVREQTQEDVAQKTGVTQALISKIENRLIGNPSEEVVDKLADALGFPQSFFFQDARVVGFPHFHSRQRQKLQAKTLARIGAMINIRRQHVAKLLRSYEFETLRPIPQIDLDDSGLTPEKVAERMREYWMVPRGPVHSVTELIERAGGIVMLSRFGTNLLDGISFRSEGMPPLFFMNKDASPARLRYALANELGHLVMHTIPDDDEKMEEEAQRFATAFLLPHQEVKHYVATPKLTTLSKASAFWGVSVRRLIDRADELKLLTEYQHRALVAEYNRAFKEGEPEYPVSEMPFRIKEAVNYHLQRLGYSVADLAQLLCVREEYVEQAYLERPRLRLVASGPFDA